MVNVGQQPYDGKIAVETAAGWQLLDPADGDIRSAEKAGGEHLRLILAPWQAILLVRTR